MKTNVKEFVFIIGCFIFASLVCYLGSSCHALVVADKLYYQGSVGKSVPDQPNDSVLIEVLGDAE